MKIFLKAGAAKDGVPKVIFGQLKPEGCLQGASIGYPSGDDGTILLPILPGQKTQKGMEMVSLHFLESVTYYAVWYPHLSEAYRAAFETLTAVYRADNNRDYPTVAAIVALYRQMKAAKAGKKLVKKVPKKTTTTKP